MSEKGSAIDLSQYVIRVFTEDYRYRLVLLPTQSYGDLLQLLSQKTGIAPGELQVFSENGRKLNIQASKKLRDVVYLRHGSILRVELPKKEKRAASPERNVYIRNYNQPSRRPQKQSKCKHPANMRCLSCFSSEQDNNYNTGNGTMVSPNKERVEFTRCDHGPNMRCLKCLDKKEEKVQQKIEKVSTPIVATPRKISPQPKQGCTHSPGIKCYRCLASPRNSKSPGMLNTQSSIASPPSTKNIKSPIKNTIKSPVKTPIQTPVKTPPKSPEKERPKPKSPQKNKGCNHGQGGKCLNCIESDPAVNTAKKCSHGPNAKCLNCMQQIATKTAHIAFDEYLLSKQFNCPLTHPKDSECPNCQPPKNPRLTLLPNCDQHEPYPRGLCNRCIPENITLKRQQYRHVDYVQFMNTNQMQNFINFWTEQKKMAEVRIGFLYGYYAQDPFYKNGIRAIVEAIYEPEQICSKTKFEIKDSSKRTRNVQLIVEALGLEKIGMVVASPNQNQYFSEDQVRTIAEYQENFSVEHSTGYQLSNFFTVLIRPGKVDRKVVEPQVFMISDQGQALNSASLFVPNPQNPGKMRLRSSDDQILPSVYEGGKKVNEFDIEFLLVNIASGMSRSNKFAMLKNNEFPSLWRGKLKKAVLREYLMANSKKPANIKYSDLNLLVLLSEVMNVETVMGVALQVATGEQVQGSVSSMLDRRLQTLL